MTWCGADENPTEKGLCKSFSYEFNVYQSLCHLEIVPASFFKITCRYPDKIFCIPALIYIKGWTQKHSVNSRINDTACLIWHSLCLQASVLHKLQIRPHKRCNSGLWRTWRESNRKVPSPKRWKGDREAGSFHICWTQVTLRFTRLSRSASWITFIRNSVSSQPEEPFQNHLAQRASQEIGQ